MYEYLCDSCHHRFDIKQKFTDDSLTICPNCGQKIHRVIQPAKVVFKGSGFYITDHKGSSGSAVLDGAKTEAKADAKPASGDDAKPVSDKAAKTETAAPGSGGSSGSSESKPAAAAPSTSTPAAS
jgi:putative FmdB family regulatory protein